MAGTIKGMTIEIGGNTEPLEQSLKSVNKEINSTQKELNQVNKLLKLDPTNTTLLKQKQELLGQQIGQTTTKLDALRQAQKQLDDEIKKGGTVNQEEYRKIEREIASAEGSLKRLKDEAKNCHPQLAKVGEALKKAGEIAGNVAKGTLELTVKGIQAMATASVTCGTALVGMAVKAGVLADDLNTLSKTTGLTTQELQEFKYASDLIDVSVETLAGALKKTTASMISAKDGTGTSAEAFKKLGVEIKNADGSLRDNNDVFYDAIRALGDVGNETERDALAMQLFGKSATELNPLIEGGIDQLAEMSKQANDLGLILSQEALDGANAFNDQLDILKANGKGLFQVIGTEIASSLTPAMEGVNAEANKIIKSLTTALKQGGLAGLLTEFGNQIGELIPKIISKLPEIANTAKDIIITFVSALKENASSIGDAIGEVAVILAETFYTILPDIIDIAITLAVSFIETLAEKLPELIPIMADGIMRAIDAIVDHLDEIIDAGVQLFLGLVEGLEKALPKLLAKLPEVIQKVVTTLVENAPMIIEAIGTIIISIANTLGQSIDQLVPAVIETILSLINTIVDNLPTIIETIVDVVIAIADALIDNIDLIIEGAVQLIVGLAQGLVQAIPKIVERLPEIIMAIVNGLIELLPKLLEVAWKLIETLASGIINAVSGLWEALGEIWEYVKKALSDKFKGIVDIGKNLIEGLWNGIKNAKDWLINKIKSLCSDALGAIKNFFGIESPSKVMANEVGNYMAEGIGVGFSKKMPKVIEAMQEKLSGVTGAFQTSLGFNDIPQVQGNQIVSENSYVTRNINNTTQVVRQPAVVELVLDGTKFARTIIPPLNDEYNRIGVKI